MHIYSTLLVPCSCIRFSTSDVLIIQNTSIFAIRFPVQKKKISIVEIVIRKCCETFVLAQIFVYVVKFSFCSPINYNVNV